MLRLNSSYFGRHGAILPLPLRGPPLAAKKPTTPERTWSHVPEVHRTQVAHQARGDARSRSVRRFPNVLATGVDVAEFSADLNLSHAVGEFAGAVEL